MTLITPVCSSAAIPINVVILITTAIWKHYLNTYNFKTLKTIDDEGGITNINLAIYRTILEPLEDILFKYI